jgi:DNA invertase Pin-like site-specific DNA recombinase
VAVGKHVAYYRVSTGKQGRSGLGLDAQRSAVRTFLNGGSWELIAEFTEVESGKRHENRPQLQEALRLCQLTGATLIVAKLDRLSRDAAFLLTLQNAGARFVCADMPDANSLTVRIMALVAQQEREAISTRTKAALAAAKARGVKLGGSRDTPPPPPPHAVGNVASSRVRTERSIEHARNVMREIERARASGAQSLRQIAAALNERGINTPRAGGRWQAAQVKAVMERAARPA